MPQDRALEGSPAPGDKGPHSTGAWWPCRVAAEWEMKGTFLQPGCWGNKSWLSVEPASDSLIHLLPSSTLNHPPHPDIDLHSYGLCSWLPFFCEAIDSTTRSYNVCPAPASPPSAWTIFPRLSLCPVHTHVHSVVSSYTPRSSPP